MIAFDLRKNHYLLFIKASPNFTSVPTDVIMIEYESAAYSEF